MATSAEVAESGQQLAIDNRMQHNSTRQASTAREVPNTIGCDLLSLHFLVCSSVLGFVGTGVSIGRSGLRMVKNRGVRVSGFEKCEKLRDHSLICGMDFSTQREDIDRLAETRDVWNFSNLNGCPS